MKDRKEKIWKRLGEENLAVSQISVYSDRIWSGDLGMGRKGGDREIR